jgi:opacity protein-like surface antigen
MTKIFAVGAALCVLAGSTMTFAGEPGAPLGSAIPRAGFFIGLGGSYNSVAFDQDLYAIGLSDVYSGTTLVARGHAEGPADSFHTRQARFSPEAQLGYFRNFGDSNWLWGAKFKYKYSGTEATDRGMIVPQNGSQIPTNGSPPTPLAGNAIIESSKTSIDHELSMLAFLGRSFFNTTVYLGVGPVLFGTKSSLNNAIGFASINGMPTDITGAPISFSSSKWMWGTAAQIGTTYYFSPSWFLDFNYTYAIAGQYKNDYGAPFVSSSDGRTYSGVAFITTSQRVTSQSLAVSLNKMF